MEPIQINVTIKLDDAIQAFLSSLFRIAAEPAEQPKPAEQSKPAVVTIAATQSSITIDSLRELAMTKMNAHRVEIKQKLTELGTPSITKLDAAKYQEMYDFLKGLE